MPLQTTNYDFAPSASLAALEQRAALLRKLREFFDERGFLEVETPLLAREVIPELHIEPIAGDLRSPDSGSHGFSKLRRNST